MITTLHAEWEAFLGCRAGMECVGSGAGRVCWYDRRMGRAIRPIERCRGWVLVVVVALVLGLGAELGHMQWTVGGASGLRGRGVGFDAAGIATWRESGVSLSRGSIGVWSVERSVAKESYDWGGGGAVFFGVNDELGGPGASDGMVRWLPRVGLGGGSAGAGGSAMFVTVPLWPVALALVVGFVRAYRRAAVGPNACRGCGYDVGGLGDRPCPECGATGKGPV